LLCGNHCIDPPTVDCLALEPALRRAFGATYEDLGYLVPAELAAHRKFVFKRHLAWPIGL
jgi:hypothetical protein